MVMIEFLRCVMSADGQHSIGFVSQTLGPYELAIVAKEKLLVMDGSQAFDLAIRDQQGVWVINGLEGLAFDDVIFRADPSSVGEPQ